MPPERSGRPARALLQSYPEPPFSADGKAAIHVSAVVMVSRFEPPKQNTLHMHLYLLTVLLIYGLSLLGPNVTQDLS